MKKVQSKENPEITGTLKVLTKHDDIIDQIIVEQGYTKFYYDNLTDLYDKWKDMPEEDKVDLEDCKRMLEKLKAWQRLKNKGFGFSGWIKEHKKGSADITIASFIDEDYDLTNDLNLLFGGKE